MSAADLVETHHMTMQFVFAGDPMCSWCYGFSRELAEALALLPPISLEIRVAGIWAGGQQRLDAQAKNLRLSHWARVEAAAGVPFNRDAMMARENFIYDTEPISRAFVAGKHLVPGLQQLRLFRALQHAFYVEGLNTTDEATLAGVLERELHAQGYPECAPFAASTMSLAEVAMKTRQDFDCVQGWRLASFPKFVAVQGDQVSVLLEGFAKAPDIVEQVLARLD